MGAGEISSFLFFLQTQDLVCVVARWKGLLVNGSHEP